jgi:hypothetical protein
MSSVKSIQKNTAAQLEQGGIENRSEPDLKFDPACHVAPVVAHELNNILTIVQGYADRLLLRHSDDPALLPQLKMISEAARRAAGVVRKATPPNANKTFRQPKNSEPAPTAA